MMAERNAGAGPAGGFARDAGAARWTYDGALTFADAGPVLEAARALPLPSSGVVDCGGIGAVDSAAVAVLLALKRRAVAENQPLSFANVPTALAELANLYGVEDILAG
jgi:phospholipid transport system transporter-binding protein